MRDNFRFLLVLLLRNIIMPASILMIIVWFVVTLFSGKAINHLEVLITGVVGLIASIMLIRKL